MSETSLLRIGVLASFLFALIALLIIIIRTFSFGQKPIYSLRQGSGPKGIMYAFSRGMLPWEKESAGKHLPTYWGGILYHMGIFSAFIFLTARTLSLELPAFLILIFRLTMIAGLMAGLALLTKRAIKIYMRAISTPDDYVANLLVDLFLGASVLTTFSNQKTPFMMGTAILLFVYIPMGKIRHCFFFFYARALWGSFFGRRGVLPHQSTEINRDG